jgi:hypothetical protein
MGFTILHQRYLCSVRFYVLKKKQLPLQCIFWQSLRRFVLIDLVYQIFKVESKVILLFRQNGIKQIDDSGVVVCFSFSLIKSFSAIYKTGIR